MTAQTSTPLSAPRLWVVLARAHRAMSAYVERFTTTEELCLSDFMVLEALLHKGPLTISQIGEKVLLANASMTSAVDRLEQRGLVERQMSGGDRRVRIVALTKKGRGLIAALYKRHASDLERVAGALTAKEQQQLYVLLKKLGYAAQSASTGADVGDR